MITVSKSDFDRQIVPDDCPDTSYLGTYSARAETQWAIDRQERGDMGRNKYRYWNPCNHTPPGLAANWAHVPNERITGAIKTHGNRKQAIRALDLQYIEEDYQRHEALNRGDLPKYKPLAVISPSLNGTKRLVMRHWQRRFG